MMAVSEEIAKYPQYFTKYILHNNAQGGKKVNVELFWGEKVFQKKNTS